MEKKAPEERLLYDRDAAAEMLSTSGRRIDELRRSGQLLSVKDGRQYKYRHADLKLYADGLPSYEPRIYSPRDWPGSTRTSSSDTPGSNRGIG